MLSVVKSFLFPIVVGLLIVRLYLLIFSESSLKSRKVDKYSKKLNDGFKKIDKRERLKEHQKALKWMNFYKKIHLLTDKRLNSMRNDLKVIGIQDTEAYFDDYLSSVPWVVALGAVMLFLIAPLFTLLMWIMVQEVIFLTYILVSLGILAFSVAILGTLYMEYDIRSQKKKAIKRIDDDYPKLFLHIYYYYREPGRRNLLSEILDKFSGNVCDEMQNLIDTLKEGSKTSEHKALDNIALDYRESSSIVNLSSKLQKCIDGQVLGVEYLNSLYTQLVATQDLQRETREQRKNELYLLIMTGCAITAFLFNLIGTTIQMMSGVIIK